MEDTFWLFAMTARDLGMFLAIIAGAWLISFLIFWLFYGGCSLAAGLSMRLGYTYGLILFLIAIFFVFRDIKEYFVWWHYTPGSTSAVMNDAILVWALSFVWLVLMWFIWPRPRRQPSSL